MLFRSGVELVADPFAGRAPRAVVADARGDRLVAVQERGAACYGAIVVSVPGDAGGCDSLRLVEERAACTNAAGGNASPDGDRMRRARFLRSSRSWRHRP